MLIKIEEAADTYCNITKKRLMTTPKPSGSSRITLLHITIEESVITIYKTTKKRLKTITRLSD